MSTDQILAIHEKALQNQNISEEQITLVKDALFTNSNFAEQLTDTKSLSKLAFQNICLEILLYCNLRNRSLNFSDFQLERIFEIAYDFPQVLDAKYSSISRTLKNKTTQLVVDILSCSYSGKLIVCSKNVLKIIDELDVFSVNLAILLPVSSEIRNSKLRVLNKKVIDNDFIEVFLDNRELFSTEVIKRIFYLARYQLFGEYSTSLERMGYLLYVKHKSNEYFIKPGIHKDIAFKAENNLDSLQGSQPEVLTTKVYSDQNNSQIEKSYQNIGQKTNRIDIMQFTKNIIQELGFFGHKYLEMDIVLVDTKEKMAFETDFDLINCDNVNFLMVLFAETNSILKFSDANCLKLFPIEINEIYLSFLSSLIVDKETAKLVLEKLEVLNLRGHIFTQLRNFSSYLNDNHSKFKFDTNNICQIGFSAQIIYKILFYMKDFQEFVQIHLDVFLDLIYSKIPQNILKSVVNILILLCKDVDIKFKIENKLSETMIFYNIGNFFKSTVTNNLKSLKFNKAIENIRERIKTKNILNLDGITEQNSNNTAYPQPQNSADVFSRNSFDDNKPLGFMNGMCSNTKNLKGQDSTQNSVLNHQPYTNHLFDNYQSSYFQNRNNLISNSAPKSCDLYNPHSINNFRPFNPGFDLNKYEQSQGTQSILFPKSGDNFNKYKHDWNINTSLFGGLEDNSKHFFSNGPHEYCTSRNMSVSQVFCQNQLDLLYQELNSSQVISDSLKNDICAKLKSLNPENLNSESLVTFFRNLDTDTASILKKDAFIYPFDYIPNMNHSIHITNSMNIYNMFFIELLHNKFVLIPVYLKLFSHFVSHSSLKFEIRRFVDFILYQNIPKLVLCVLKCFNNCDSIANSILIKAVRSCSVYDSRISKLFIDYCCKYYKKYSETQIKELNSGFISQIDDPITKHNIELNNNENISKDSSIILKNQRSEFVPDHTDLEEIFYFKKTPPTPSSENEIFTINHIEKSIKFFEDCISDSRLIKVLLGAPNIRIFDFLSIFQPEKSDYFYNSDFLKRINENKKDGLNYINQHISRSDVLARFVLSNYKVIQDFSEFGSLKLKILSKLCDTFINRITIKTYFKEKMDGNVDDSLASEKLNESLDFLKSKDVGGNDCNISKNHLLKNSVNGISFTLPDIQISEYYDILAKYILYNYFHDKKINLDDLKLHPKIYKYNIDAFCRYLKARHICGHENNHFYEILEKNTFFDKQAFDAFLDITSDISCIDKETSNLSVLNAFDGFSYDKYTKFNFISNFLEQDNIPEKTDYILIEKVLFDFTNNILDMTIYDKLRFLFKNTIRIIKIIENDNHDSLITNDCFKRFISILKSDLQKISKKCKRSKIEEIYIKYIKYCLIGCKNTFLIENTDLLDPNMITRLHLISIITHNTFQKYPRLYTKASKNLQKYIFVFLLGQKMISKEELLGLNLDLDVRTSVLNYVSIFK